MTGRKKETSHILNKVALQLWLKDFTTDRALNFRPFCVAAVQAGERIALIRVLWASGRGPEKVQEEPWWAMHSGTQELTEVSLVQPAEVSAVSILELSSHCDAPLVSLLLAPSITASQAQCHSFIISGFSLPIAIDQQ